jgi:hypothetical protein
MGGDILTNVFSFESSDYTPMLAAATPDDFWPLTKFPVSQSLE